MRVLLDTNAVSALRRPDRQDDSFRRWLAEADIEDCFISVITRLEIRAGVLKKARADSAQGAVLGQWANRLFDEFAPRTIPFDEPAADLAATISAGRSRGLLDTMIAATALAGDLALATRNTPDFADIPRLTVVNPWAA